MIVGTVIDGNGKSVGLMADRLDRFEQALGYRPVPGTLNVLASAEALRQSRKWPGVRVPDDRYFYAISVNGYPAHAKVHKRHHLEIVADVRLRDHLGLATGDQVKVERR